MMVGLGVAAGPLYKITCTPMRSFKIDGCVSSRATEIVEETLLTCDIMFPI